MSAAQDNAPAGVVVIGGGIVGLASARAVQHADPAARVVVVEKEADLAAHQTGRNSGVVHSGLYYPPSSQKRAMVAEGRTLLFDFCERHGIEVDLCGKVVVATSDDELPRLRALEERGRAHGLDVSRIGPRELAEREPHAVGLAGLVVPEAGITDYVAVCRALADEIVGAGGEVRTGAAVTDLAEDATGVTVTLAGGEQLRAAWLVNCAGLFSDRVAAMAGGSRPAAQIMPFRGEYYELTPGRRHLVRHLIYPVPDPRFPFLGVHFTRMVNGEIHAGPNAVLALAREGYDWSTVDVDDLREMAANPGAWKLARKYWRTGAAEMFRSLSKRAFTEALQRLVPEVTEDDLVRSGAGIRAQALRRDGSLVDDFEFADTNRSVHVVNAPSPAATASLAIGAAIAGRLTSRQVA